MANAQLFKSMIGKLLPSTNAKNHEGANAYTLSWNVLNVPTSVVLSGGDPILNNSLPSTIPIVSSQYIVFVEPNTTAFFTVTNADDPTCFATIQIVARERRKARREGFIFCRGHH